MATEQPEKEEEEKAVRVSGGEEKEGVAEVKEGKERKFHDNIHVSGWRRPSTGGSRTPAVSRESKSTPLIDDEFQDEFGVVSVPAYLVAACQHVKGKAKQVGSWAVLVTGCTGFLGSYILSQILRRTCCLSRKPRVAVVVRGNHVGYCEDRLREHCMGMGFDLEPYRKRIVVLATEDLAKPGLGIHGPSQEALEKLTIRCVVHSAAVVDEVETYAALRGDNVLTTLNLLLFAAQNFAKFAYVSSKASLSLASPAQALSEDCDCSWAAMDIARMSGYAKTKWMSEQLCMAACREGLPVSVVRVPLIAGHSGTGALPLGSTPARVIAAVVNFAEAATDLNIDCISVDIASQIIAHVALSQYTRGVNASTGKFVDDDTQACITHVSTTLDTLTMGKIVEALWVAGYRRVQWTDRHDWLDRATRTKSSEGSEGKDSSPRHSECLSDSPPLANSLAAAELVKVFGNEMEESVQEVSTKCLRHMISYLQLKGAIPTPEAYMNRINTELDRGSAEDLAGDKKEEEIGCRMRAMKGAMLRYRARGRRLFFEASLCSPTDFPQRIPSSGTIQAA